MPVSREKKLRPVFDPNSTKYPDRIFYRGSWKTPEQIIRSRESSLRNYYKYREKILEERSQPHTCRTKGCKIPASQSSNGKYLQRCEAHEGQAVRKSQRNSNNQRDLKLIQELRVRLEAA